MYIFKESVDYECYIRAINTITEEDDDCAFLQDKSITKLNVTTFEFSNMEFLSELSSFSEYFIVIDNTRFPH